MTNQFEIKIRFYNPVGDKDFIYSSWIKSYKNSSFARAVPSPLYEMGQRHRIKKILENEKTNILIACDPTTPELIFGYIIFDDITLHYLYVKSKYRQMGIATALCYDILPKEKIIYTHKCSEIWLEKKIREVDYASRLIYNPYLLDYV